MTQTLDQPPVTAPGGALPGLDQAPAGDGAAPQGRRGWLRAGGAIAGLAVALAVVAAAAAYLTWPHAGLFARVPRHAAGWAGWAAAPAALVAVLAGVAAWRAARRVLGKSRGADVMTVLAASVAMAVSATGMWAFFARYVPGIHLYARVPIFAFLELATLACALRARDNMRDFQASGLDGKAMWILTGINSFLASLASTTVAEALFRLTPPVVAAFLWERALVSERKRSRPREREGITWRVSPERILVRLGLADPGDQTVGQAAARRRLTVLALATERAAALDAADITEGRKYDRADQALRRAMRAAVEHTNLASDPGLKQELVSKILILRSPRDLVTLDAGSPWAQLIPGHGDRQPGSGRRQAGKDPRKPGDDQRAGRDGDREPGSDGDHDAGGGATPAGHLATELARAQRQADGTRIHSLLAGRDDYADLARSIGERGGLGSKRMLAAIGMYAARGAVESPAKVLAWVAETVPGQAGKVDKKTVRDIRVVIMPALRAAGYAGADGPEEDALDQDNTIQPKEAQPA